MKSVLAAFVLIAALSFGARAAGPELLVSSRVVDTARRSLLLEIREPQGQTADELRLELPRNAADGAVLSSAPGNWKLDRDGRSVRLSGPAAHFPVRLRVTIFDLAPIDRLKAKVRLFGKDLLDAQVTVTELPALVHASSTAGFLYFPAVVTAGETVELKILDPAHTPADGQWFIAGVPAMATAPDRIRVRLPDELSRGTPIRVSFFDAWGERIVDALSAEEARVAESSSTAPAVTAPKISGCARYAFIGQSVCVCGDFPEASWNAIRLDGQPATVVGASRHALRIALPDSLAPGMHEITGDPSAGFSSGDQAPFEALRLIGSIGTSTLVRLQSTTMQLALTGTTKRMKIMVSNLSPGVISIPGGNYQEIETSGGTQNSAERRVDGTGRGKFEILYSLDEAQCPCDEDDAERPSMASSPVPIFVPRRVLATIAIGTPAAMYGTAQAVAAANGLAVLEVFPVPLANEGLAVFEILDGVGAAVKAVALALDPRVTLAQLDIVYDASQGAVGAADLAYGPHLIGADQVQAVSRGDGVRVAVVDTGIDSGHPALKDKVADYSDLTGTGWTPDAHGSLVAGVIAADAPNSPGWQGVAPGAKLVGIKSCIAESPRTAAARCWSSTLARGIDLAAQKNARVVNLSVGGPEDKLLAKMVNAAMAKGIAVVSAAGNDGPAGRPSYPAAFEGVIAVTAVDAAERLYPKATQGTYVSLAAPGVDILSTGPGGRTEAFSGTSAATAFVSGAVALLLQQRPNLSLPDLRSALQQTAKRLGSTAPDREFGYGLLDICRAMSQVGSRQAACR